MFVIELSSAYNPGDMDSGKLYPHKMVVAYHIYPGSGYMQVCPQYGSGNLSSSNWSGGVVPVNSYEIALEDYQTLIASASSADELPFNAANRIIHSWLLDKGYISGTLISSSF